MPRYGRGDDVWSIEQVDKTLTITENGKPSVRRFVSADHAAAQSAKLVDGKLGEGYEQLPPEPPRAPKPARKRVERPQLVRNAELEAVIAANPDDVGAWAVYGDWLAQQGDPRGELVALQLSAETSRNSSARREAARDYLADHGPELLHPLGKYFPSAGTGSLEWRRGFVRTLALGDRSDLPRLLGEVLVHPAFAFVESIALAEHDCTVATAAVEILAAYAPRTLRELSLAGQFEDLGPLLAALPPLRAMMLSGGRHAPSQAALRALVAAPWPSLERLRLDVAQFQSFATLAPLFERRDLPNLMRIALKDCRFVDEALAAIVASPFAPQLQVLDFGGADLTRAHGELLLAHQARLPLLRELWCRYPETLGNVLPALRGWVKHVLPTPPPVLAGDDGRYNGVRE